MVVQSKTLLRYVKETFLKYCDPLAKRAVLNDLEEKKFEFKDIPNIEIPLDINKMVAQEISILKNNQIKDVLKYFDLLRTQENLQSTFDSKDLLKLPVYWLNESVNTLHQNEQLVSLQKRMIELSKENQLTVEEQHLLSLLK